MFYCAYSQSKELATVNSLNTCPSMLYTFVVLTLFLNYTFLQKERELELLRLVNKQTNILTVVCQPPAATDSSNYCSLASWQSE